MLQNAEAQLDPGLETTLGYLNPNSGSVITCCVIIGRLFFSLCFNLLLCKNGYDHIYLVLKTCNVLVYVKDLDQGLTHVWFSISSVMIAIIKIKSGLQKRKTRANRFFLVFTIVMTVFFTFYVLNTWFIFYLCTFVYLVSMHIIFLAIT